LTPVQKYDTLQKIQKEATMDKRTSIALTVITGFLIFLSPGITSAQQEKSSAQDAAVEIQWIWGEVVSVDPANKAFAVKYLDYDTDMEKQMAIAVDDKTGFENSKSLADIKIQDTVSIDYVIGADGKNVARNISVEKIEDIGETEESLIPEKVGTGPITENKGPVSPASIAATVPVPEITEGEGRVNAAGPVSPVDVAVPPAPVTEVFGEGQVSAVGPVSPVIAAAPAATEEEPEDTEK
jgi:hypothetical protein